MSTRPGAELNPGFPRERSWEAEVFCVLMGITRPKISCCLKKVALNEIKQAYLLQNSQNFYRVKDLTHRVSQICCCSYLVAASCLTLGDPMDCGPPGSSIHGIFQARVLEWGDIAFSEISGQYSSKLLNSSKISLRNC